MNASAFPLTDMGRQFSELAIGSQRVFRAALEALAHPGRIVELSSDAHGPDGLHAATCALALALLDQDTRLWRSPALAAGPAGAYLRFHTGCSLTEEAGAAQFALVIGAERLRLNDFPCGSDDYPDRSATLIVQVDSLREGSGWRLSGPGIKGVARLAIGGLPEDFPIQWKANDARYPRGVDLFLACGTYVCGLPRTTRIEA